MTKNQSVIFGLKIRMYLRKCSWLLQIYRSSGRRALHRVVMQGYNSSALHWTSLSWQLTGRGNAHHHGTAARRAPTGSHRGPQQGSFVHVMVYHSDVGAQLGLATIPVWVETGLNEHGVLMDGSSSGSPARHEKWMIDDVWISKYALKCLVVTVS